MFATAILISRATRISSGRFRLGFNIARHCFHFFYHSRYIFALLLALYPHGQKLERGLTWDSNFSRFGDLTAFMLQVKFAFAI